MTKLKAYNVAVILLCCFAATGFAAVDKEPHEFDYLTRARYAVLKEGLGQAKTGSVLLRGAINSSWTDQFSTLLEIDYVETFGDDQYNDLVLVVDNPAIPDVPGLELNQAQLAFQWSTFALRGGRQRLLFDDQRMIGSNGFWQNDQTFDSIFAQWDFFSNSHLSQTYIANANRIFGDDAGETFAPSDIAYEQFNGQRPRALWGDHQHNTWLTRLELNEWDYSQWVAYAYLIDNKDLPEVSNDTFGGIYNFRYKQGNIKYRLRLEFASQERTTLPTKPVHNYFVAEGGLGFDSLEVGVRHEVLTSKDNSSFVTVLGSDHDFNGWADVFLTSGLQDGLVDDSIRLDWRLAPWRLQVRYHFFQAESVAQTFGEELDFDINFKPSPQHTFSVRFADFKVEESASSVFRDERKVFFDYTFSK